MDQFDRERFASVYRTLAEILERERHVDRMEDHLSFVLGDLARRVFVGAKFLPPDDLLEEVAELLRSGKPEQLQQMGNRLREHAQHLDDVTDSPI